MDLAGGSWIFLAFLIAFLLAVIYGYWTVKGSGIGQRGWRDRDQALGMSVGKDPTADVRTWGRGASKGRRRDRRMTALEQRTAEAIGAGAQAGHDPSWRARVGENVQLVAPVDPKRDHVRGGEGAPVTLVEYGEHECRYCKEAAIAVRALLERYGDDLRLVFRHFPQPSIHPGSRLAAIASEAAARQGRFWELHELLAREKKALEPDVVRRAAQKAGLDLDRFDSDLEDPALAARVDEDVRSGIESGVNGTPTFFLNNVRFDDDFEEELLARAIEDARAVARDAGARDVA